MPDGLIQSASVASSAEWCMVPPDGVDGVWPHVEPMLVEKCERYRPQDVRAACSNGEWQMWIVHKPGKLLSVVLTQIVTLREQRAMSVLWCGGEGMGEWVHYVDDLAEGARSLGCDLIEWVGRAGWARALPNVRVTGWRMEMTL